MQQFTSLCSDSAAAVVRVFLCSLFLVPRVAASDDGGGLNNDAAVEAAQLTDENQALRLKLKTLEAALKEEIKFSYVVVKGYITDAENVFMETMEVDEAKQYCNANLQCKGFTFAGPDDRPGDEVTVTFKAGSKVVHDSNWVSFIKESSMFGALHGASAPQPTSCPHFQPPIVHRGLRQSSRATSTSSSHLRSLRRASPLRPSAFY